MSSITNLSPAPSSLASLNLHAHGHKRGVHARTLDDSGGEAQASAGATRDLFGRLLQSLEKVIGVQLGTAASAAARAGATANRAAVAASPTASVTASAAASKLAGTNINVTA